MSLHRSELSNLSLTFVEVERCPAEVQRTFQRSRQAGKQFIGNRRIAISPPQVVVRFELLKALDQAVVVRLQHTRSATLGHNDLPQRNAQGARVARQPKFLRRATARADPHAVGCGRQTEYRASPVYGKRVAPFAVHDKMKIGIVGQRNPGRGPERSSSRRQTASTTGPPVSTGAQGCCGGRCQPALALRNSQRLPSSR